MYKLKQICYNISAEDDDVSYNNSELDSENEEEDYNGDAGCRMINYARYGKLEKMQSLYLAHRGECWHWQVIHVCLLGGHLDCAKYAMENGCPVNWDKFRSLEEVKLIHEEFGVALDDPNLCIVAAEDGNLDLLTYAHEHGCPWEEYTCIMASTLDCLKYAHEHGCPWHSGVLMYAVLHERMDQYEYAVKNGLWWDDFSLRDIFIIGLLPESDDEYVDQKLKQLLELGCPVGWAYDIASEGIRLNKIAYLKFAINHGKPSPLTVEGSLSTRTVVDLVIDAMWCHTDTILRFLYDECGLCIPPEHKVEYISDACRAFLEERGHVFMD
jgi:hypothetical protein